MQKRQRTVAKTEKHGGKACVGSNTERKICNTQKCRKYDKLNMYILDLVLKLGCNGGSRAWTSEGWLKGRISHQIGQNGLSVYSDKMKHIPIIYIKIGI